MFERLPSVPFSGRVPDVADPRDFGLDSPGPQAQQVKRAIACRQGVADKGTFLLPRKYFGDVRDQGSINDCCACAGTALMEYRARKDRGLADLQCSVGFLYKVTRDLANDRGNAPTDSRTTMKALTMIGVCEESSYVTSDATLDLDPNPLTFALAANFKATNYWRLDVGPAAADGEKLLAEVKRVLLGDIPLMFSVHFLIPGTLREFAETTSKIARDKKLEVATADLPAIAAFRTRRAVDRELGRLGKRIGGAAAPSDAPTVSDAKAAMLKLQGLLGLTRVAPVAAAAPAGRPADGQKPPAGAPAAAPVFTVGSVATFVGHSMVACGFSDERQAILVRNSWSADWADGGYGWLSYDFVRKGLTEDWWFINNASLIDTTDFSAAGGGGAPGAPTGVTGGGGGGGMDVLRTPAMEDDEYLGMDDGYVGQDDV